MSRNNPILENFLTRIDNIETHRFGKEFCELDPKDKERLTKLVRILWLHYSELLPMTKLKSTRINSLNMTANKIEEILE